MRSSAIAIGLLTAVLLLLLWASRYALFEVWPQRVQELLLSNGDLLFIEARSRRPDLDVVASSYPRSLLALEWPDGRLEHGFIVVEDRETEGWWMEFATGPERVQPSALHRYYAPNAMLLGERLALAADRVLERRAFGRTADAGVASPEALSENSLQAELEDASGENLVSEGDEL